MFKLLISIAVLFVPLISPVSSVKAQELITPKIAINEIKLGGPIDGQPTQYIELVNLTDEPVDLQNWTLEYAKEGYIATNCAAGSWELLDTSNLNTAVQLSGVIPATNETSFGLLLIEASLNDNKSGSLQLIDNDDQHHDLVGWGDAAPCADGETAMIPTNGKSIERFLDCNGVPATTSNNKQDFRLADTPSPASAQTEFLPSCSPDEPAKPPCNGLALTEILPNPAGTDDGNEFIEIYNPGNDEVILESCQLKVGTKVFQFDVDETIEAKQHKAFFDSKTGLTLVNSAGGEVVLVMDDEELSVVYPGDLKDDVSWGELSGKWQQTLPTPNAPNQNLPAEETNSEGKGSGLGPCPAGKFRNPETNRCKNTETASSLKPCSPGQVRNPDTNRCRSITSSASSLVPCKPGQIRNPETNRCRSVAGASSSLVPCQPGYERNPETNRCRKVANTVNNALTQPAATNTQVNYPAMAVVGISVLGYGLFEYKQEIIELIKKVPGLLGKH